MDSIRSFSLVVLVWLASACPAAVRTGLDNVEAHRALFAGKRIGIIANHTAYDRQG
ncbi:MAG: hypothetical protein GXX98_01810, partial [Planctomycetes bacterium]|nr:hypothetical protein [Planctomycetota bacterium]